MLTTKEISAVNNSFRSMNETQGDVWPISNMIGGHEKYSERVIAKARKARQGIDGGPRRLTVQDYTELLEAVASELVNDSSNW